MNKKIYCLSFSVQRDLSIIRFDRLRRRDINLLPVFRPTIRLNERSSYLNVYLWSVNSGVNVKEIDRFF